MTLNTRALAITAALLWGGAVLLVGLANLVWPGYGTAFLDWIASFYPGYHGPGGAGSVLLATLYAVADGAVGGGVFAGLYNRLAGRR